MQGCRGRGKSYRCGEDIDYLIDGLVGFVVLGSTGYVFLLRWVSRLVVRLSCLHCADAVVM